MTAWFLVGAAAMPRYRIIFRCQSRRRVPKEVQLMWPRSRFRHSPSATFSAESIICS